jgi:hypothetical protein
MVLVINKTFNVVQSSIEALSWNQFCNGKEINITYFECVFVALGIPAYNAHALHYIVICGLPGFAILFRIIS